MAEAYFDLLSISQAADAEAESILAFFNEFQFIKTAG